MKSISILVCLTNFSVALRTINMQPEPPATRKRQLPHVTWHCLAVGWGRPGWLARRRRKTSVTHQWRCGSPWTCLRCIAVRVKHQGRPGRLNTKGCSRHCQQQDRSDLDLVAQHLCQPRYSKFLWIGNTRTPEYRSGGLMRNLENWPFGFGQNFQKFSVFVRMASGVREKV